MKRYKLEEELFYGEETTENPFNYVRIEIYRRKVEVECVINGNLYAYETFTRGEYCSCKSMIEAAYSFYENCLKKISEQEVLLCYAC